MLEGEQVGPEGEGQQTHLATFYRRNQAGAVEQVRVSAGVWNGRHLVHLRTWWQALKPTPEDPGWRPTKNGVTIREGELDEAIDALERVRAAVHADGRSTSRADPGERNPRPRQIEKAERAARSGDVAHRLTPRQQSILDKSAANRALGAGPTPKPPWVQQDALDEFSEYRK
jgi:hypothetical protein